MNIPVISPGLIQLRKGFCMGGLINGGAYIRGGGLKRGIKKVFRNEQRQC